MAVFWYSCAYCGTVVKQENSPAQTSCSAQNSSHWWIRLEEEGEIIYQCRDCKIVINTKTSPQQAGCCKASSHYWQRL